MLPLGVSNYWTGIWNGTMELKMEWNSEHTQLHLIYVTGVGFVVCACSLQKGIV